MVMISHAAYPLVTKDRTPASLSKKWITEILRKRIGYRNLIVSDDLEMGAIQAAAPVGEAAVEHLRAGGDLCLVCHHEDYIEEAYEKMTSTVQRDSHFARRVAQSTKQLLMFKNKSRHNLRASKLPSMKTIETLTRKLWEFDEQIRISSMAEANRDFSTRL
jgi:beta-N-acetylhexosaminidase